MANDFAIQGLDGVLKKLRGLAPALQKKMLNKAMRKGMGIVRKSAADKAKRFDDPSTKQQIWKEIVVRSNAKKARTMGPGTFLVQVGVRGGAKAYVNNRKNRNAGRVGKTYEGGGNVYHWRFKEFGTVNTPADPFMRPALADNVEPVISTVATSLWNDISKYADQGNP